MTLPSTNKDNLFRPLIRHLLPAYILVSLVLMTAIVLWQWKGLPLGNLTRDPSNILRFPFYFGAIAKLGFMLWTITAALCFFAGAMIRDIAGKKNVSNFLIAAGLLSSLLLFDDLFLFHEKFFPNYLHIPEIVTYSTYCLLGFVFLIVFRKIIFQSYFLIFFAAGFFLGLSLIADTFTNDDADSSIKFLIEDGLKLFGIASWLVYFVGFCISEIRDLKSKFLATK